MVGAQEGELMEWRADVLGMLANAQMASALEEVVMATMVEGPLLARLVASAVADLERSQAWCHMLARVSA